MRYTITMPTQTDPMVLANGRTVRLVAFQNTDGSYPTRATEVTSETMAVLYSTSSKDKRGYLGSFPVGILPKVATEIYSRQANVMKATRDERAIEATETDAEIEAYLATLTIIDAAEDAMECDEVMPAMDTLITHDAPESAPIVDSDTDLIVICMECDKRFATIGETIDHEHMRPEHQTTTATSVKCTHCDAPAVDVSIDAEAMEHGAGLHPHDEREPMPLCARHAIPASKRTRMPIGPRGTVHATESDGFYGANRTWRRTINGTHYTFSVVNMPDGELRLFAGRYNGYGDHDVALLGVSQDEADRRGMWWSCAWNRVHSITLRPATLRISKAATITRNVLAAKPTETVTIYSADDRTARIEAMQRTTSGLVTSGSPDSVKAALIERGDIATDVISVEDYLQHMADQGATMAEIEAERVMGAAETRAGTSIPVPTVTVERPDMTPDCQGSVVRGMCTKPSTVYLACCGAPVCSYHATKTIEGACPACGSIMTTVLANFDAGRGSAPDAFDAAIWPDMASVTSTLTISANHEAPGTRDVSRHDPTYGVLVEYWDDRAVRAVIGSYPDWETAAHEVERFKRLGRFEYVHGVIAVYDTLSDF